MIGTQFRLDDVIEMTASKGEGWAVAHARRLLELIRRIGGDANYNAQALTLATYLHDWGAFPGYALKGVDHALRSRQVAEAEILPFVEMPPEAKEIVLEAIELHDYRDQRPTKSIEALLLREADMLEFLGMIGMAREFARGPKDVEACYRRILERRAGIQGRLVLPGSQAIAKIRLERMRQCLDWLMEESFGIL
jgi:uncharacterized protein